MKKFFFLPILFVFFSCETEKEETEPTIIETQGISIDTISETKMDTEEKTMISEDESEVAYITYLGSWHKYIPKPNRNPNFILVLFIHNFFEKR